VVLGILVLIVTANVQAQGLGGYYVIPEDVEIRFIGAPAPAGDWHPADVVSITYSEDPVGTHDEKADIGVQGWEASLQLSRPSIGKVVLVINVISLPENQYRKMELRVKVRVDDPDDGTVTGPLSDPNVVKIIGKPSRPVKTGYLDLEKEMVLCRTSWKLFSGKELSIL